MINKEVSLVETVEQQTTPNANNARNKDGRVKIKERKKNNDKKPSDGKKKTRKKKRDRNSSLSPIVTPVNDVCHAPAQQEAKNESAKVTDKGQRATRQKSTETTKHCKKTKQAAVNKKTGDDKHNRKKRSEKSKDGDTPNAIHTPRGDDNKRRAILSESKKKPKTKLTHNKKKRKRRSRAEKDLRAKCDRAGVKFSWIEEEFIPSCGGRRALKGMTTEEVLKKRTMALTKKLGISYCDLLKHQGRHDAVQAVADAFISHWFGYFFLDVVDAIRCNLLKNGGSLDSYIWWDLFSINQHGATNWSFEWLSTTFKGSIGDIGKVIMVMSPWNDPKPFTRGWCVFEAYCAIATNSQFEIALSGRNERNFITDIKEGGPEAINQMLAEVRAENSQCSVEAERDKIFQVIRDEVGFSKLNGLLFEEYRSWVIETAVEALRSSDDGCLEDCANMHLVGQLYCQQGNHEAAHPYLAMSFGRHKAILGDKHPDTLASMNELANLYKSIGDYDKARSLYIDCLNMKKQVMGRKHLPVDTLATMNGLAQIYMIQGDYEEAKTLFVDCLKRKRKSLGTTHPNTLRTLNNLARLYQCQGDHYNAKDLYVDCLDKRKNVLGVNHPDTLATMNNLASLFESLGHYDKAEDLYVGCLDKRKQILGPTHPSTLISMNNLAGLIFKQGDTLNARLLLAECLETSKRVSGVNHPNTIRFKKNLISIAVPIATRL